MLKTYQFKTHCKGDSHSSKTANINFARTHDNTKVNAGAPAGFQARVGKIGREAPKNFFRLPTLVFSLPTLPYVTVAHPAHSTEADLTNQEGPCPALRLT